MIPKAGMEHAASRSRVSGPPRAVGMRHPLGVAAVYAAAVLAVTYAAVSLYRAAGGTALLPTVGGTVED